MRPDETCEEIKQLRAEVKRLAHELQVSNQQHQHFLNIERLEREKFMLQVENELKRRLPPKNEEKARDEKSSRAFWF